MGDINDQSSYWDGVAWKKTFTHPLSEKLLAEFVKTSDTIVDYGCGYGRTVSELIGMGYNNITGYDTSAELIRRGCTGTNLPIYHIQSPAHLPVADHSVDCILLFAVLTCIPANEAQHALIDLLFKKLKPGGYMYISDYYLQTGSTEMDRYEYLNGDPENYGVFSLPEGAVFRHHTREWITELFSPFTVRAEIEVQVQTMNGHTATAFQLIVQKQA